MYVAPERINNPQFQMAIKATPVDLVVRSTCCLRLYRHSACIPGGGELVSQPESNCCIYRKPTSEIVEDVKNV